MLAAGQKLAGLSELVPDDGELSSGLALRDLTERSLQLGVEATEWVVHVGFHVVVGDVVVFDDKDPLYGSSG
eukprot:11133188-Heterocapsa_arctica.AAC.1